MTTVWIVRGSFMCGTSEVLSVWTTREGAEEEAERVAPICNMDVDIYPQPVDSKWEGL